MTALLKYLPSEMKGVQEKESIMGVRGRQKKIRPSRSQSGITRTDSDPRDGFFCLSLKQVIDPYIPDHATISEPLRNVPKRDVEFLWQAEQQH